MRRLWLLAAAVGTALAYTRWVRPWHLRWGATGPELFELLPGDEFCRHPVIESTRAVTIDAPIDAVWPWLAQIGQGRGGFYSYTWFENLFLTHMRNAGRIHPEWQHVAPGDSIRTHPLVAIPVAEVEAGHYLILGAHGRGSWAFVIKPMPGDRTRFVVRGRSGYTFPDLKLRPLNALYWRGIYEPLHFIMERGMMLGLKQRAETAWRESRATAERPVA